MVDFFVKAEVVDTHCGDSEATVYTSQGQLELVSHDPVHADIIDIVRKHGTVIVVEDGTGDVECVTRYVFD